MGGYRKEKCEEHYLDSKARHRAAASSWPGVGVDVLVAVSLPRRRKGLGKEDGNRERQFDVSLALLVSVDTVPAARRSLRLRDMAGSPIPRFEERMIIRERAGI